MQICNLYVEAFLSYRHLTIHEKAGKMVPSLFSIDILEFT